MITCREFIEFLMQYLEHALPDGRLQQFERHLDICQSCQAYLKGYEDSVKMGKRVFSDLNDEVPAEVPPDLVRAILATREENR